MIENHYQSSSKTEASIDSSMSKHRTAEDVLCARAADGMNGRRMTANQTTAKPNQVKRPIRMCLGCRSREDQGKLLRIALVNGALTLIECNKRHGHARRMGRGAYVHPRKDCMEKALRKGRIERALRTTIDPYQTSVLRQLGDAALSQMRASEHTSEPAQLSSSPCEIAVASQPQHSHEESVESALRAARR